MLRYPLAAFVLLRLYAPPLAPFWGRLRERLRKAWHGPGKHCPAPVRFVITAAELGLADWRFAAERQSARREATMPIPVFSVRPYVPRSA